MEDYGTNFVLPENIKYFYAASGENKKSHPDDQGGFKAILQKISLFEFKIKSQSPQFMHQYIE